MSSDPNSPTNQAWDIRILSSCKSMKNFPGKLKNSEAESEETQLSQSVKLINIEKESENLEDFTDIIKETISEKKFDLKEDWRNGPFSNIIFDKKAVSKESFHHHLIRTYEGLNHVKTMKLNITAEMIRGKSVELKRTGNKYRINVKKLNKKLKYREKGFVFRIGKYFD